MERDIQERERERDITDMAILLTEAKYVVQELYNQLENVSSNTSMLETLLFCIWGVVRMLTSEENELVYK